MTPGDVNFSFLPSFLSERGMLVAAAISASGVRDKVCVVDPQGDLNLLGM